MALGVPPVVTALGSFTDRIVDGESGFLFEPNKEALVDVVRRLHAQPDLLERVARNLASRAQGRTTAEMVNDYRTLLPLAPRPIARFRVGVGRQTGLTEPYRHLTEAYTQLAGAYAQSIKAYEHTKAAFEQANGELGQLKAALQAFGREFESIDINTHWWRVLRATRLVLEFREKIRSLGSHSNAVGDAGSGERGRGHSTPRKAAP
jgi:hypothetical protein